MHRSLLFLVLSAALVSCAGPSPTSDGPRRGGSIPRDEWGHRPGPRGFGTVMIDAGHGGKDSGAVSRVTGQREKDAALDVARRVANKLRGHFNVKLLRADDLFVDLDERVDMASRAADVLVSVHFNSGPPALVGPEVYYWRVDSHGLAVRLHRALGEVATGQNNRGLVRQRLRLTRNPDIACVLVECGYLSNAAEARRATDPGYRDRLASAIANALIAQAREGDAGTGPLPAPRSDPPSRPTDAKE